MTWKQKSLVIILLTVSVISFGGWLTNMIGANQDYYRQVKENIILFGQVYKELSDRYVEEIDPEKFMRAGIDGMLDRLDPYTVFIDKEASDELRIITEGKYYGVGMLIVKRNGWPTVADQPFEGTPALKAGIREGDQIIKVDSMSTENMTLSETAGRLRGSRKGTKVEVTILRIGEEKPLVFHLIRDEIKVEDISYSGMLEPGIGLIKLTRFSRNSGTEVQEAIEDLTKQGMKALIFDLRSNPGGLLDAAVAVADNFLDEGQLIVSTRGRWPQTNKKYLATTSATLGSAPLVVLVDEFSASASEIVAGAIQDLDRGVLVGENTFGKGLVQTVVTVDRKGDKQLKITTQKYYTPSGRLIQKPDVFDKSARSVFVTTDTGKETEVPEKAYKTTNGRLVKEGGGITPDVKVENPPLSRYELDLLRKTMFFNFGLEYANENPDLSPDFKVDDQLLNKFFDYVQENDFDYQYEGEEELDKLVEVATEAKYNDEITNEIASIRTIIAKKKQFTMRESTDNIRTLIKREIAGKLWGRRAYFEKSFEMDPVLQKAISVIKEQDEYSRILSNKEVGQG